MTPPLRRAPLFALCATALVALVLCACGDKPAEPEPKAPPRPVIPAKPAYVRPKLSESALNESMYYPLDTCVVSGKTLVPHSHYEDIGGRLVRTYNQHQVEELKKDPEKYLAILDEAYRAQQAAAYPLWICLATGEPLPEKPVELVLDIRHDYVQQLRSIQRERQQDIDYRYTVSGRLLRFKDEAALASFKAVDSSGRMPVAELGMDRYVRAMVSKLRPDLFKTNICPVNRRTTGRPDVDPQTGGYRQYLLGPKLYVLCCKTCVVDMDEKFQITVESAAHFMGLEENRVIKPEQLNPLVLKRLPDPPQD